jgi:hypothetical protein
MGMGGHTMTKQYKIFQNKWHQDPLCQYATVQLLAPFFIKHKTIDNKLIKIKE